MTKLDKALERYEHNAEYERAHGNLQGCLEFRQLCKWLKELRAYRKMYRKEHKDDYLSEENGKVCCNCRHNKRKWTDGKCECKCEISGDWLSYLRVMTGWCKHWAKERSNKE